MSPGRRLVHSAQFSGRRVDFSGAEFSGGRVDFRDARFSGAEVYFRSVQFSEGRVDLRIPIESDHSFRSNPIADSGVSDHLAGAGVS